MDEIKKQIKFPEGRSYNDGLTLLQNIVVYSKVGNNFSLLEKLISEYNVDINDEIYALCYCVIKTSSEYSDIRTLKFLLDNNKNVNYINGYGNNILYYCEEFEKFKVLFDYKANINLIDNDGKAFIHYLVNRYEYVDSTKIVEFLIDKKVDLNIKTKDGKNVFDIIDKNECPKMYELLMKYDNLGMKENKKSKIKKNNITKNRKGIKKKKKNTNKNNRVFHRTTTFHL